jgi:protein O-GlcNAc transferase
MDLKKTTTAGPTGNQSDSIADQFNVALQHHRFGRLIEAEQLCRKINAVDPNHVGSFHLRGLIAHQLGRDNASELLARAVAIEPNYPEGHNDLGVVLTTQGKIAEAAACFERAVILRPNYAEAHNNLGSALSQLGKLADAIGCFDRALAINPNLAAAHIYLGNSLRAQGKIGEAVAHYERALSIDPNLAMAHYNLGAVFKEQGRIDKAVKHYRHTIAFMPSFAEAHNNLGTALEELGQLDEAVVHYRRALAINPNFAGAHNNLANALRELGKLDEAITHYQRAIALQPEFVAAHYNFGMALRRQSRFKEAAASFESALKIKPDFIEARFGLCMAQLPILYIEESEITKQRAEYKKHLTSLRDDIERAEKPGRFADIIGAHQPFYLAYQGYNDRDLQALYGSIVCRIMDDRFTPAAMPAPPEQGEPVRVGIVSGFFRHHSNWKIPIKGWLTQLDRKRFRVFGYYTEIEQDAETKVAIVHCDRFVHGPLSIGRWRQTIIEDAPHVLIYPEVGMDRVSAQLAAQRLAPVQCTSWGHPETSGFPTLDYYLSSELMEPPEGEDHYTEQLVRIPNLSIFYEPNEPKSVALDRTSLGLRATATVYWCGQAVYKYLPQFDQVFARIASEVEDCQFVFIAFPGSPQVTDLFRTRLEQAFASSGLNASNYCVFLPRLDPHQFVAAIGQCDIVLDSIGWSGCNSILESLVHNFPIVTVKGALMRSRHAAAILTMMGVVETIAETTDEYVSIAIRLAKDIQLRTMLKIKIAENKHRLYRDVTCITALEEFLDRAGRGRSGKLI